MRPTSVNWEAMIRRQQESGLTQRDFCKKHHLAYSTFNRWKQKLGFTSTSLAVFKPQFIELDLPAAVLPVPAPEEVVVELPFGVVMRFRGMRS